MSSTEEVKPPYAQQVEDDLNELIEAVGKYRMPSDYQAVGFHAASAGLTAISEGDAVLPEGFQPRLIPAVLITNSGEGLLGDGGSTKLKSSFGTVYAAFCTVGSGVIMTLKADEIGSTLLSLDEISRVGAITFKKFFMHINGVEFLHEVPGDPEESLGRVALALPIEVSDGLDEAWQRRLLDGLQVKQ